MEIENANAASLSNYEVMLCLQKVKDSKMKHKGQLATITYETLRYLEGTHCKQQNWKTIENCLKALNAYNLTENEKLVLINLLPTTPLEIQPMIEGSEERLTEEQVEEILQIIIQHFPHLKKEDEEQEQDMEQSE